MQSGTIPHLLQRMRAHHHLREAKVRDGKLAPVQVRPCKVSAVESQANDPDDPAPLVVADVSVGVSVTRFLIISNASPFFAFWLSSLNALFISTFAGSRFRKDTSQHTSPTRTVNVFPKSDELSRQDCATIALITASEQSLFSWCSSDCSKNHPATALHHPQQ